MEALIVLGVIAYVVYRAFREGKREGSRKGFGVDRGPMVAGWDPTPFGEMAKETKDALKASIPESTFDDPDPKEDDGTLMGTLSRFLREKGFIVLGWNRVDPSPGCPVEAWAYAGPLSFASATPSGFGLGPDCHAAEDHGRGQRVTVDDHTRGTQWIMRSGGCPFLMFTKGDAVKPDLPVKRLAKIAQLIRNRLLALRTTRHEPRPTGSAPVGPRSSGSGRSAGRWRCN